MGRFLLNNPPIYKKTEPLKTFKAIYIKQNSTMHYKYYKVNVIIWEALRFAIRVPMDAKLRVRVVRLHPWGLWNVRDFFSVSIAPFPPCTMCLKNVCTRGGRFVARVGAGRDKCDLKFVSLGKHDMSFYRVGQLPIVYVCDTFVGFILMFVQWIAWKFDIINDTGNMLYLFKRALVSENWDFLLIFVKRIRVCVFYYIRDVMFIFRRWISLLVYE